MKKVALLQPTYLPYPGYFQIMSLVDEFYYLTDVELNTPSYQHRNRIRMPLPALSKREFDCHSCGGVALHKVDAEHQMYSVKVCQQCGKTFGKQPHGWGWLDVPLIHASHGTPDRLLYKTLIDNEKPWMEEHLVSIGSMYRRSEVYETLYPELEELYGRPHELLYAMNVTFIEWFRKWFDIKTPTFLDLEIPYDHPTDKTERIIEFCKAVGADCYLEPEGGSSFIDAKMFDLEGIELRYFHFDPPEYVQLYEGFVQYMSALDLLFCLGPRAKNKLKAEWFDHQVHENLTPDHLPGGIVMGRDAK